MTIGPNDNRRDSDYPPKRPIAVLPIIHCHSHPSSNTMHAESEHANPKKRTRYERYVNRPSMRKERGFACIGLDRPTDSVNVGHALRAAFCFDARLVIIGGNPSGIRLPKLHTDPMRSFRHVPVIRSNNLLNAVPEGTAIVGIELSDDASTLMDFNHPERACYVFGPENGSISNDILDRCSHKVMIPTMASLNLGMTVNIVMYDRLAKTWPKMQSRLERIDASAVDIETGLDS